MPKTSWKEILAGDEDARSRLEGLYVKANRFRDVLRRVKLKPEARYVLVHAEQGFTANVPLADLDRDDAEQPAVEPFPGPPPAEGS